MSASDIVCFACGSITMTTGGIVHNPGCPIINMRYASFSEEYKYIDAGGFKLLQEKEQEIRRATLDEAIRRIDGSTLYSLFEDSEKAFWHAKGINDALDVLRQMRDE